MITGRARTVGQGTSRAVCALLRALGFGGLVGAILAAEVAAARAWGAETARPADTPGHALAEEAGPEQLKRQTRIAVDTNAPPTGAAATAPAPLKDFSWDASWEGWNGLHIVLTRKKPLGYWAGTLSSLRLVQLEETRLAGRIGVKLALDAAAFATDDDLTGFDSGGELRRARLYAKGDCLLLLPVSYELEIGYVPGSFYVENSYLEFPGLGILGSLKGGQFQVPMSLVNYGSSRDMMFMEPATAVQALAPGVNAGIQLGRPVLDQRMTWALGFFTDAVGHDFGDATDRFGRTVGRLTGLPFSRGDPTSAYPHRLVHLGASASWLYAGEHTVRYRSRPESHLAPYVVDTGEVAADGAFVVGAEIAWVNGPLSLQGEYLHSWLWGDQAGGVDLAGFYVQASWLLTGESRPYNLRDGTFARLIPRESFNFGQGGWGAWEIAGRYSFVDLDRGGVDGGQVSMLMAGVNWYLHSHVKWRFNYGFGRITDRDPEGNLHVFETRIEVDL